MGVLIDIFLYSIGNMFLGVFLTILGIVLMFVLIKSWRKNSDFSIISYIVGGILFLFLSFQSILLCGAVSIKSYTDDLEIMINNMVASVPRYVEFSTEDSQAIMDQLIEERPLIGHFVNLADFQGHTPETIGPAMMDELRSVMNAYIFRRIMWSLLFVILSVILVLKTMEGTERLRRGRSRSYGESSSFGRGGSGRRKRYED